MQTQKTKGQNASQTIGHITKSYIERFSAHKELVKRALFKGPKRILHEAHTKMPIIDKIKTLFGQISGSIWILIASGIFLLYAVWSTFGPKTITPLAVHPASDIIKDPNTTPTQNSTTIPETNNETIVEDQKAVPQEILVETQAPAVVATLQHIYNMYNAINDGSYAPTDYFDTYMQTSDLVKTYFTQKGVATFISAIQGGINMVSTEEFPTDKRDRVGVRYTISYKLANNETIFTETLEVVLRPQAGGWRIGTVRCQSRGCSVNPFFNPEKYGIK